MAPELDGILETSLYVKSVEDSATFYQKILGLEVLFSEDQFHALSVSGRQVLLLFQAGSVKSAVVSSRGTIPPHDGSGQVHLAFSIPANMLESWENWLEQNGVAIEGRMDWSRGGKSLYFRDPDQHLLELATPGVWTIY